MINIQDIIPFMKDGWVAMDRNHIWVWWEKEPCIRCDYFWSALQGDSVLLSDAFDIAPADDWTKSLIKVGEK